MLCHHQTVLTADATPSAAPFPNRNFELLASTSFPALPLEAQAFQDSSPGHADTHAVHHTLKSRCNKEYLQTESDGHGEAGQSCKAVLEGSAPSTTCRAWTESQLEHDHPRPRSHPSCMSSDPHRCSFGSACSLATGLLDAGHELLSNVSPWIPHMQLPKHVQHTMTQLPGIQSGIQPTSRKLQASQQAATIKERSPMFPQILGQQHKNLQKPPTKQKKTPDMLKSRQLTAKSTKSTQSTPKPDREIQGLSGTFGDLRGLSGTFGDLRGKGQNRQKDASKCTKFFGDLFGDLRGLSGTFSGTFGDLRGPSGTFRAPPQEHFQPTNGFILQKNGKTWIYCPKNSKTWIYSPKNAKQLSEHTKSRSRPRAGPPSRPRPHPRLRHEFRVPEVCQKVVL